MNMGYFCDRIEHMAAYVPGEQPDTADVIKINTNENPYPPSPAAMAAIRAVREEHLRRYPNPTSKPFRCAAARLFDVTPEMVICSNGMDELLRMLIQACCDANRPLGYPTPTYTLYSVLAETVGAPVRAVPFPADYRLPAEQLAATDARLFLVVNPNAPTGTFTPIDEIARFATMVRGRAIIGVDEAYVNFARDNAVRLVRQFENVIVLRTLSKGYSLAGLRFGFAIGPEPVIAMLNKVKDSYNLDAVAIAAATAAISDTAYAEATWKKVIDERDQLLPRLRALGFELVVRRCGRVSAALHDLPSGGKVGIRGPYGTHFPVDGAMKGRNVLFLAGGIGLAPLRSAIQYVLNHRADYGKVAILYGTKSPPERLFLDELAAWSKRPDVEFRETVDKGDAGWTGNVGVVTKILPAAWIAANKPVVVACGPPVMYKFVVVSLYAAEVPDASIYVSLERRMKCGVGKCGHCQIDGLYVCMDGPVFNFADLVRVKEAI